MATAEDGEGPAVCVRCGREAAAGSAGALDGSRQAGPGGPEWVCAPCTRENVRSMEARLDESWW